MSSWTMYVANCKSRSSAISRCCFLGRELWRKRCKALKSAAVDDQLKLEWAECRVRELERANQQLHEQKQVLENDIERLRNAPGTLERTLGRPLPWHKYPVGLIVLCVNLGRAVGLRRTVRVLTIFFEWLEVSFEVEVPCYQTIRVWMQRIGVDRMQRTEKVEDGIWLVDHSNQIGTEKVLTILRVRESQLPAPGTPLRHEDMELLLCQPGTQWKREDVQSVYEELAAQKGFPISVLTDGAVELRDPVQSLINRGKTPLCIRDLKHILSNKLESLLTKAPEFQEFTQHVRQTRAAVQQTELAQFTPPTLKQKSRFMNLKPLLSWGTMVLWHLQHAASKARAEITPERMQDKLGWLSKFEKPLKEWYECQEVISEILKFVNANGIFCGSVTKFRRTLVKKFEHPCSQRLLAEMMTFIQEVESELKPKQRLPSSTEILESSFALYKQLEGQHAKGGFTTLLPAFGALLAPTTPDEVRESFARVKVKDVQKWVDNNIPTTLTARRQLAYREASPKDKKGATHSGLAL